VRTGLYPGTFDPITNGHADIVRRAARLVDHLVIGVAVNRDKGPLFALEERVAMIEAETRSIAAETGTRIEARPFDNLLMRFAEEVGANVSIRGLRAVSDFEYEFQMAGMNRKLIPNADTVFLTPSEQYTYISSSLIREIAALGGDVSDFVAPPVLEALHERLG